MRLQQTILALFFTYNVTTSIVSSVLTILHCSIFPYWCLDLFLLFRTVLRFSIFSYLLVGLSLKIFHGKPLFLPDSNWFCNVLTTETHFSVVKCIFNFEFLFFVFLLKVGIKFSKKPPYCKSNSIKPPKKVISWKKMVIIKITLIKVLLFLYIFIWWFLLTENVGYWP